jgi:hypothetical protein
MIQQSTCTVPWKTPSTGSGGDGRACGQWPLKIGHLSIRNHFPIRVNAGEKSKVGTLAGGAPEAGISFPDRPVTDTGIQIIPE